ISTHKKAGNACLDCHEASIGEQIHEAQVWLAGDFTTPLAASGIGTNEFCLGCHELDKIVAATDNYSELPSDVATEFGGLNRGLNPHRSHMEDIQCGDCHSMHGASVMQCNSCHYLPLPEGWTDVWGGAGLDVA
ncbi:MAG: cytochrome c3 family protein, partial [Coriobacteriales bacterium]|nr:cytochrome c3 family protein [Coriobacteriales bacterium]